MASSVAASPTTGVEAHPTMACPQNPRRAYYRPGITRGRAPWRRAGGSYRSASTGVGRIATWRTRQQWLSSLSIALLTPQGEQLRRRWAVRRETVMEVARVDAATADSRGGRGVATANATVARHLGCCDRTVQRARQIIEALGYAATVIRGRYLTTSEREAARAAHGGVQLRMASERALTVPRTAFVQINPIVRLPRRGPRTPPPHPGNYSPTRASARTVAASRPRARTKTAPRPDRVPVPLAVQRLAGRLRAQIPALAGAGHAGHLCRALITLGLDETTCTVEDAMYVIETWNRATGYDQPHTSQQHNPVGLFVRQMRAGRKLVGELPSQVRRREAEVRRREAAARRTADAAHRAQLDAEAVDPQAQARIAAAKAAIRATIEEARQRARYTH